MKKHASSHGLAVLVCTVTSGIIVKIGYDKYPEAIKILENLSRWVKETFGVFLAVNEISTLTLAVILAVIWGAAFSFMHSDN
jgi:hypothetical protein